MWQTVMILKRLKQFDCFAALFYFTLKCCAFFYKNKIEIFIYIFLKAAMISKLKIYNK